VHKKATNKSWAYAIKQFGEIPTEGKEAKRLYYFLSSTILPEDLTSSSYPAELYKRRSLSSFQTIQTKIQSISPPPVSLYKLHSREDNFVMSKLLLFGSQAFPLLTTGSGIVVMAGSYYGKGKVVVLPHEALLQHEALMRGAMEWVKGFNDKEGVPLVSMDPVSRAGGNWVYVNPLRRRYPFEKTAVKRDQLMSNKETTPRIYITEGHYDDHSDCVLDYVRNGGGLIIAGHAWFWASQRNHDVCLLTNHPGNKIITHFGIAFSSLHVDHQGPNRSLKLLDPPGSRHSYYYMALRASKGFVGDLISEEDYTHLSWFHPKLRDEDRFSDIVDLVQTMFT